MANRFNDLRRTREQSGLAMSPAIGSLRGLVAPSREAHSHLNQKSYSIFTAIFAATLTATFTAKIIAIFTA